MMLAKEARARSVRALVKSCEALIHASTESFKTSITTSLGYEIDKVVLEDASTTLKKAGYNLEILGCYLRIWW